MGLYKDIIAPCALALIRMEHRGIPVDLTRRDALKKRTQEAINVLKAKIRAETVAFHAKRRASIEAEVATLEGEWGTLRRGPDAGRCPAHPEYAGFTKRAKCPGCHGVYEAAADLRARDAEIARRLTKGRTRLKQVGEEFNVGNDHHWRWLLYDSSGLGLAVVAETESGLPSVDKDAIAELQRLYPEVEVLEWRVEIQGALHLLAGVLSAPVDERGRAHFAFSLHRTENGRVASGTDDEEEGKERVSEAGNAQNIADEVREIFCAPPGFAAIELDMKQVELRVMAWLARDMPLLEALWSGRDIHSENTALIWGCALAEARKHKVRLRGRLVKARDETKTITHGWDYGRMDAAVGKATQPFAACDTETVLQYLYAQGGINEVSYRRRLKAAERAPDPEGELRKLRLRVVEMANTVKARGWRLAYFERWKGLAAFQEWVIREVEKERRLVNPFGRVLEFWNFRWNPKERRWICTDREEALAFLPASTVGEMIKARLKEMEVLCAENGGELVNTVHDSYWAIVPEKNITRFVILAEAIMERPWPELGRVEPFGDFWVPCEVAVGRNFGKRTEANEDGLSERPNAAQQDAQAV